MKWQAEIKANPKHFCAVISATVVFEADDFDAAEELADFYADALAPAEVDAVFELAQ